MSFKVGLQLVSSCYVKLTISFLTHAKLVSILSKKLQTVPLNKQQFHQLQMTQQAIVQNQSSRVPHIEL